MRKVLAALLALAAFTATVALVNSMNGAEQFNGQVGMNFNIQDAAEFLATLLGEPLLALAVDADVPLSDPGLIATLIGALGLALPATFAFVLFSR